MCFRRRQPQWVCSALSSYWCLVVGVAGAGVCVWGWLTGRVFPPSRQPQWVCSALSSYWCLVVGVAGAGVCVWVADWACVSAVSAAAVGV